MLLSADALYEKAHQLTGIDIEDGEVVEPMTILVDALNREADLSAAGTVEMEKRILRLLMNRLRMERDFRRHPEIQNQKVAPPLFITGFGRSGTTKLQKVLSVTGDFTALPFWMTHNPSLFSGDRNEKTDARIADTEQFVQWSLRTSPAIWQIHPFLTHEPEETNPIEEQSFFSLYLLAFAQVPTFVQWTMTQDPTKSLRYLRRTLQYLQWQLGIDGAKPWVLKNPVSLGREPAVKAVFPDAEILVTHRHPVPVIPSSASFIVALHKLYSDRDISAIVGPGILEAFAGMMDQQRINRKSDAKLNCFDISYADLTRDSLPILERIYQRIDRPFSERAVKNVTDWEIENQQHKHGAHKYSPTDFNLTEQAIADRFRDYIAEFGQYLER